MIMRTLLCPTHADWLTEHEDRLLAYFEQVLGTGQKHLELGCWSSALPFLGAAYQLADAMLGDNPLQKNEALEDFGTSVALLILAFNKLSLITQSFEVFVSATERIESLGGISSKLKRECLEKIGFAAPAPGYMTQRPSARFMAY